MVWSDIISKPFCKYKSSYSLLAVGLQKKTMFESIAASLLNHVLGKYIKDLDSSNLRLAILQGKHQLC